MFRKSKGSFYDSKTLIMVFYYLGGIVFLRWRALCDLRTTLCDLQWTKPSPPKQQVKGPGSLFLLRPGYCPKKDPHKGQLGYIHALPKKSSIETFCKALVNHCFNRSISSNNHFHKATLVEFLCEKKGPMGSIYNQNCLGLIGTTTWLLIFVEIFTYE